MKNVMYQEALLHAPDSSDGYGVFLFVTNELNGVAVFVYREVHGHKLVRFFFTEGVSRAIKWAITEAQKQPEVINLLALCRK